MISRSLKIISRPSKMIWNTRKIISRGQEMISDGIHSPKFPRLGKKRFCDQAIAENILLLKPISFEFHVQGITRAN